MATVGKVVTQTGNAESLSPKRPAQPGAATNFDNSLEVFHVGHDSSQPIESREPTNGFWTEAARRRTVEELRTLVRAIQSGVTDQFQLTDLIFYARHPDLIGVPLTKDQQL